MSSQPAPVRPVVLLGISGSIAAYKACDLIRLLRADGCRVIPVMTRAAAKLISPLTIGVLAGETVHLDPFAAAHNSGDVDHIGLVQEAACYVAAPATANHLTKLALGIADDYPSLVGVAFPRPWVIAPAMNSRMWANPVIQGHLTTLRQRGARIVEPDSGLLACGEIGPGKLAPIEAIRDTVLEVLRTGQSMAGLRVLITAGGTREPVDAVRYVGNRSSGRMGSALAQEAAYRGAQVTLLSTVEPPVALPAAVQVHRVETAAQMGAALDQQAAHYDILVMAAAVADYTVREPQAEKLHRDETGTLQLTLEPTADLLAGLVAQRRPGQTLIGFAAETSDLAARARAKYVRKGVDLLVANDVSDPAIGFGSRQNAVLVITGPEPGAEVHLPQDSKEALARRLWDLILQRHGSASSSQAAEGETRYAVS